MQSLIASSGLVAISSNAHAGIMKPEIPVVTYRDFAENRGQFAADTLNIPIYGKDGSILGYIPRMMSFDSVNDGAFASLVDPQFTASAGHVGYTDNMTFSGRFIGNANSTVYGRIADQFSSTDFKLTRLNKIVTETEAVSIMTDTEIMQKLAKGEGLVLRVGAGGTAIATGYGQQDYLGYGIMCGGTIQFIGGGMDANKNWGFSLVIEPGIDPDNVLQIGTLGGDSGSPVFAWNEKTNRWEYLAANSAGGGTGAGYGKTSYLKAAPEWSMQTIASYKDPVITVDPTGGAILWKATDSQGIGTLTQDSSSWTYHGLADGIIGWNPNGTQAATDAQMDATRDLIFDATQSPQTIILQNSIDMGAGSLTFKGDYILDSADPSFTLNSAGFIIERGALVETRLSGKAGDEWRKIGAGTLVISGTGNNEANLNLGGAGMIILDRQNGYAAKNILLNGGAATLVLMGENQIGGTLTFGFRGGILDMNGHNLAWNGISHHDDGAVIANFGTGSSTAFTFTGSGNQTYKGGFLDGKTQNNGLLTVIYNPGSADSTWTLTGNSGNRGGYIVNGGTLAIRGTVTQHAGGTTYTNPNDWHYANLDTSTITVNNGATLTIADHAKVTADIIVNQGTFKLTEGIFLANGESVDGSQPGTVNPALYGHTGTVTLNGSGSTMHVAITSAASPELSYANNISGQGNFLKTGGSGIYLQGSNTFSGTKTIENGYVRGGSLAAMGDTSTNKWKIGEQGVLLVENIGAGQALTDVLPIIDRTSTGVVALTGNQDRAIDLSTHSGLIVGAASGRTIEYGQNGTSETLGAVNGDWTVGGGGGTLNLNFRLEDSADGTARKLTVGNRYGTGTVVLTNTANTFSGGIDIKGRIILDYTDIAALGSGQVNLDYGTMASLGNTPQLMIGKTSASSEGILLIRNEGASATADLDMTSKPSAALGAWGTVRYTGNITVGANQTYRFGGNGTLILGQTLAANGTNGILIDAQGTQGGIIALESASATTGNIIIRGNRDQSAAGSISLRLDTDHALDQASGTSVLNGGILDLNGRAATLRDLDLAGGTVGNTSATAATLGLEFVNRTELKGGLAGKLNVTYRTTLPGAVTLSGANTYTGTATLASGTYNLTAAGAFGSNANTLAITQGATLNITSQVALGQKLTGTGTLNLNVAMSGNLLTNTASDFRGTLNLNAGRHTFAQNNIGTGCTIVVNEGAQAYLSGTFDNNFILNSTGWNASDVAKAGALRVDGGTINGNITMMKSVSIGAYNGAATINGNIIGTGYDLTKLYGNTLTLNAASNNTFRNLNINGGTLAISGSATSATAGTALGTGTVTLANGTTLNMASSAASAEYTYANGFVFNANSKLNITGGAQTLAGTVKINGTTTIDTGAGTALTLSGQLSGTAQLTKNGTGTLVLSGNNTGKTGNLLISGGTLRAIGTNALGSMNTTMASGTVLDLGGRGITNLDMHGATLTLSGQNTLLYNTAFSGSTFLIDSLASVNLIASGAVTIGLNPTAGLGLGSYTLIDSTRTLDLGSFTLSGAPVQSRTKVALTLGGTNNNRLILNITGGLPENVVWKGTGTLETSVTNTANITSSDNTYYNFDNLTLAEQSSATTASHTLTLGGSGIAPASILITGHDNYTVTGAAITGTASLTKEGSGTLTLASANSYTGGTDIRQGIVNAQTAGALGTGGIIVRTGGTLKATDAALSGNNLTLEGGRTEISAAGISKAGLVTMKNNGTWLLTAAGTATGTIAIAAGDTGTIHTNGKNLTWNGDLFGEGSLTKQGTGSMIIGKTQNTAWTGTIDVAQGILQLGIDKNTAVSTLGHGRINIASGATLALKSGTATHAADLSFANGSTLAVYDGAGGTLAAPSYKLTGDVTLGGKLNIALTWGKITELAGTISDAAGATGSISITGSSETPVLLLSGANTFTGGVTLNSAATQLCITNRQSLGTGDFTFTQGTLRWKNYQGGTVGAIILNGTDGTRSFNTDTATITMANAITGNGSLTKTGAGLLRIDGAFTHTGGTTVSQGTLALRFNGNAADISGNIAIAQNAALSIETTARLNGNIAGNGELRIEQGAIAVVNTANTFTGTVNTIGTTVLNHQQGATNAIVSLNGQDAQHKASLILATTNTTVAGLSGNKHSIIDAGNTSGQPVVVPPRWLNVASAVDTTFSGTVTGSVSIVKTGIGTLAMNGASIIGNITLGDSQSTLSLANTTLEYIGTGNDPKLFVLQGNLTLDNSNSIDISQLAYHSSYVTFLTGTDATAGTGLVLTNDIRDLSIRLNIAYGALDTETLAGTSFTVNGNNLPAWLAGLDTNTYTLQFENLGGDYQMAYILLTGQGTASTSTGTQAIFAPRLASMAYNTANGTSNIPEPATTALILLGAAGLLVRRRRIA